MKLIHLGLIFVVFSAQQSCKRLDPKLANAASNLRVPVSQDFEFVSGRIYSSDKLRNIYESRGLRAQPPVALSRIAPALAEEFATILQISPQDVELTLYDAAAPAHPSLNLVDSRQPKKPVAGRPAESKALATEQGATPPSPARTATMRPKAANAEPASEMAAEDPTEVISGVAAAQAASRKLLTLVTGASQSSGTEGAATLSSALAQAVGTSMAAMVGGASEVVGIGARGALARALGSKPDDEATNTVEPSSPAAPSGGGSWRSLWSNPLANKSMPEVATFIDKAKAADLGWLARRQFFFESSENPRAAANAYLRMQEAIARKIPEEYDRPVIDLKLYFGGKHAAKQDQTIGILGGTGPLSDAHLTTMILSRLEAKAVKSGTVIHLFSLPPPRTASAKVMGSVFYLPRLSTFLRHDYPSYFLASNTAHLNYTSAMALSRSKTIVHLPRLIADEISEMQVQRGGTATTLILGTKQASEGKLYDDILAAKQMRFVRIDPAEQDIIQNWIDKLKSGLTTDADPPLLKDYVVKLATKYGATDILLSCTELPLGLRGQKIDGFAVHDTEEMIADIIAGIVANPPKLQPVPLPATVDSEAAAKKVIGQ